MEVAIDDVGDASYTFADPAAWDFVPEQGIAEAASLADVVVFGTAFSVTFAHLHGFFRGLPWICCLRRLVASKKLVMHQYHQMIITHS